MKFVARGSFVTSVVLAIAAMAPAAAKAELASADVLCAAGAADAAAFRLRPDFQDAVAAMAATCPEVVLMLLDTPTFTIPDGPDTAANNDGGGDGDGDGGTVDPGVDDSGALSALAAALAALTKATDDVASAQVVLASATQRVEVLRMVRMSLLAADTIDPRILADFTVGLRDALTAYNAAKDNLSTKKDALNTVREAAKEAVNLAGLQEAKAAADDKLAGAVGEGTYSDLLAALGQAETDAAGAVATKETELATVKGEAAALQAQLDAMGPRTALAGQAGAAASTVSTAQQKYDAEVLAAAAAQQALTDAQAELARCREHCRDEEAKRDNASRTLDRYIGPAGSVQKALDTLNTQKTAQAAADAALKAYDDKAAEIAAAPAKITAAEQALADAKAEADAAAQAKKDLVALNDALDKAVLAVLDAEEAVELDEDVIAAEGEVDVALQGLVDAAEHAIGLLEGSPEEEAAKQAILDAQAALDAALANQDEAVANAAEVIDEVADVDTAAVDAAVDTLNDAIGGAGEADTAADEADAQADEVLADHQDAKDDLREVLVEDGVIEGDKVVVEVTADEEQGPVATMAARDVSTEAAGGDTGGAAGGDTGGAAGGDTGGDAGGAAGGDAGGAAGGDAGGAAGGDTGGEAGGAAGGDAGGDAGGAAGGDTGGAAGGDTGGDAGGATGGDTGGDAAGGDAAAGPEAAPAS